MINHELLREEISSYKEVFATDIWPLDKHQWQAVKHFQDHWQPDASNFAEMLKESLSRTANLLTSTQHYPRAMIEQFAWAHPERVRAMFAALFDETADLIERMEAFKAESAQLLQLHGGTSRHFQDENAISTYLWLRYPDAHYVYKYSVCSTVAAFLGGGYEFVQGRHADNIRTHQVMYNELRTVLASDDELRGILAEQLTPDCYPDTKLITLTMDVAFFISFGAEDSQSEWFPEPELYHPGLTTEDWLRLLHDPVVFTPGSLEVMKRVKDAGGQSSCVGLAHRYGRTSGFYNGTSSALAGRVAQATECHTIRDNKGNTTSWWPILFTGRNATKSEDGTFIWRLRDELSAALDQVDLSGVPLYADDAPPHAAPFADREPNYWLLVANPRQAFTFASLAVGDTEDWTVHGPSGTARRMPQNFVEAREGDLVIGYESTPAKQIAALGRIAASADSEHIRFVKTEGLVTPIPFAEIRALPELANTQAFVNNMRGSLFKLTADEYQVLLDLIREANPTPTPPATAPYSRKDFLREVYVSGADYDRLVTVLRRKKNIILQGAPGVGKTFAATRLAWSLMGVRDDSRIEFVQFHQNYSYEDFVMGFRPTEDGFELQDGVFYRFCTRAANRPDQDFYFIIDEINRGNISRIFGELLMLIEPDYRGKRITLAYGGRTFTVPPNVYLIGMMNTADRSLAVIDYALRRRFSFFTMVPGFGSERFKEYQRDLASKTLDQLLLTVQALNTEIAQDPSLGSGFVIGHSYFCAQEVVTEDWLRAVVDFDLLPMLEEYWFDDPAKVETWRGRLRGVLPR